MYIGMCGLQGCVRVQQDLQKDMCVSRDVCVHREI
jgi:hypothetical protein